MVSHVRKTHIGPTLFIETIATERYCNEILRFFIDKLSEVEKLTVYFQQNLQKLRDNIRDHIATIQQEEICRV